jgi:DNA-directed RNA polymerase subunit RPC12/RpoP
MTHLETAAMYLEPETQYTCLCGRKLTVSETHLTVCGNCGSPAMLGPHPVTGKTCIILLTAKEAGREGKVHYEQFNN